MSIYPTCSVIGHVDVGKTSFLDYFKNSKTNEVRGITQQMSAYQYNKDHLKNTVINPNFDINFNLDGIIFLDTPGHEYFTSMRTITSSISHLVLVMIDIVKGIEPIHIEILKYLRTNHIDFIIVLNKLDRIYNWKSQEKQTLKNSFAAQSKETMKKLNDYINNIICQLAEQEINACAYYNNTDYKTFISMVPLSAKTGEGISDLLLVISKIVERKMKLFNKSIFYKDIGGFIIDSRVNNNFGKIFTIINHNGEIKENTSLNIIDNDNNKKSCVIKHIICNNNRIESVNGYNVVDITLTDKTFDLSCGDIFVLNDSKLNYKQLMLSQVSLNFEDNEIEQNNYIDEDINEEEVDQDIIYDKYGISIITMSKMMHGALYKMFKTEMNVPVALCTVDKINKNTVIKTINNNKVKNKTPNEETLLNLKYDTYRVIILFEPTMKETTLSSEVVEFANKNKIKIISSNSIYRLKEKYTNFVNSIYDKVKSDYAYIMDCELQILQNCIFMKTSPLLFGVKVLSGQLNIGTKLLATKDNKSIVLGVVKSMEINRKQVTKGIVKDEICIRVESLDKKIIYKTDFDETFKITTFRTKEDDYVRKIFDIVI